MVCLRFDHLKGVMKDHQKKSELKTPKINPILDVFSKATENSSMWKMKQKVITANQIVFSKKVDFRTFGVRILHVCESAWVWERLFGRILCLKIRESSVALKKKSYLKQEAI